MESSKVASFRTKPTKARSNSSSIEVFMILNWGFGVNVEGLSGRMY